MIRRWLRARRVRQTADRARVLDRFKAYPDRHWYVTGGLDHATGIRSAKVERIVWSFERLGLVVGGFDPDPSGTGRRQYWLAPRRTYRFEETQ